MQRTVGAQSVCSSIMQIDIAVPRCHTSDRFSKGMARCWQVISARSSARSAEASLPSSLSSEANLILSKYCSSCARSRDAMFAIRELERRDAPNVKLGRSRNRGGRLVCGPALCQSLPRSANEVCTQSAGGIADLAERTKGGEHSRGRFVRRCFRGKGACLGGVDAHASLRLRRWSRALDVATVEHGKGPTNIAAAAIIR